MNRELRNRIIDLDLSERTKSKLIDLVDKYLEELYDLQQENKQLKNNWNKLKEWLYTTLDINCCELIENKMQEILKGEYESKNN